MDFLQNFTALEYGDDFTNFIEVYEETDPRRALKTGETWKDDSEQAVRISDVAKVDLTFFVLYMTERAEEKAEVANFVFLCDSDQVRRVCYAGRGAASKPTTTSPSTLDHFLGCSGEQDGCGGWS